jgi:DNA-binding transcriptional ArsR family regulator
LPSATLSFHLKALLHAGLIMQTREGRHLIYRADYARMQSLLAFLTDNCCEGVPCMGVESPSRECRRAA